MRPISSIAIAPAKPTASIVAGSGMTTPDNSGGESNCRNAKDHSVVWSAAPLRSCDEMMNPSSALLYC